MTDILVEQILYYLVRIEPYSTLAIQLQGGKFDHADRMFFDMASTWKNVLEDMSDVKELVSAAFSSKVWEGLFSCRSVVLYYKY